MATVKFNLEADEAKAVSAFLKVVDSQKKAENQFKRTTAAGNRQSQGNQRLTLTQRAQNLSIVRMIDAYASLTTVIGGVTGAVDKMNAANDRAADSLKMTKFSSGALFQVYKTPEQQDQARAAINATRSRTGMSREEANQFQFQLASNGLDFNGSNQSELFSSFYGSSKDPSKLITGSSKLISGFGRKEVGDERRAVNKLLVASENSPVGVDEMGIAASKVSLAAARIGATDEETLAMLSQMSIVFDSSDKAATAISRLASDIDKGGLGGQGFAPAIQQMIANPKLKDNVLVKENAKLGFGAYLKKQGDIQALNQDLIAEDKRPAGQGAGAKLKMNMFGGQSALSRESVAIRGDAIATQQRLIAEENRRATGELGGRAAVNNAMAKSEINKEGFMVAGARQSAMDFVKRNFEGATNDDITGAGDTAAKVVNDAAAVHADAIKITSLVIESFANLINSIESIPENIANGLESAVGGARSQPPKNNFLISGE